MEYTTLYYAASGRGMDDCCFLGQRFLTQYGFKPDLGESWVMKSVPPPQPGKAGIQCGLGVGGWLTGLWRSSSDVVFVTDLAGRIRTCSDVANINRPGVWSSVDFKNTIMQGVWGLDDQHVFVWCKIDLRPEALFWNGTTWTQLPTPPGEIAWMHGISPEDVYAVGANGLVAPPRWEASPLYRAG